MERAGEIERVFTWNTTIVFCVGVNPTSTSIFKENIDQNWVYFAIYNMLLWHILMTINQ